MVRWTSHAECVGDLQVHTNFRWGEWSEEVTWVIKLRLSIFLKWTIQKQKVTLWSWFLRRHDPIAWSCTQSNKPFLGHIKYAPFLSSWAAVKLPKKVFVTGRETFLPCQEKKKTTLGRVVGFGVGIPLYFLYCMVSALHSAFKRFPQTISVIRNICALEDSFVSSKHSSIPRSFFTKQDGSVVKFQTFVW